MEKAMWLLRLSLGVIFVWFGVLKIFNASPVTNLIADVAPISFPMQLPLIGLFEIVLGVGFFSKRFYKLSSFVMIGYLIVVTLLVLVFRGFKPWFPLLSYDGEFVLKNLVFIASGWALVNHKEIVSQVLHDEEKVQDDQEKGKK